MKRSRAFMLVVVLLALVCIAIICLPALTILFFFGTDAGGVSMGTIYSALITHALLMLLAGITTSAVGLALALMIFRFAPNRGRRRLDTLLYCMGGVSPVCWVALCYCIWGSSQTYATLLFAATMAALPFSCRYTLKALESESPMLYESARALGMSGAAALFGVLVPGARRGILGTFLHTCGRIGAMAAILNVLGRSLYLTGLLTLSPSGEILPALLLAVLCVGCFVLGNAVLRRRSHA